MSGFQTVNDRFRLAAGLDNGIEQCRADVARCENESDVGQAMAKNPVALIIPCHRVLAAGGKVGRFLEASWSRHGSIRGSGLPLSGH